MVLTWVNYLCVATGTISFLMLMIISTIVLIREPKQKLNWLFAASFFFLALAYVFLPIGAFTRPVQNPSMMILLTKIYVICLFTGFSFLFLSSIAFNYGTRFVLKWEFILPLVFVWAFIVGLLFGLPDNHPAFYTIRNVTGKADVEMSLFFSAIFYPICIIYAITILVFFIRAYKFAKETKVQRCLDFFIVGYGFCMGSLIPNILSNALSKIWDQAQSLNGVEFIMLLIGFGLMLTGFFINSGKTDEEEQTEYVIPVN
jgi:hypothetical protein